jgi:hypothetical protein
MHRKLGPDRLAARPAGTVAARPDPAGAQALGGWCRADEGAGEDRHQPYHYSCVLRFRCERCAAAWWARLHTNQATTWAGRMRRCARRTATRRSSWTDQRIRSAASGRAGSGFLGCRRVGAVTDDRQHGEGQHHQRDVPVPAVPERNAPDDLPGKAVHDVLGIEQCGTALLLRPEARSALVLRPAGPFAAAVLLVLPVAET